VLRVWERSCHNDFPGDHTGNHNARRYNINEGTDDSRNDDSRNDDSRNADISASDHPDRHDCGSNNVRRGGGRVCE
jgi:hypothetical protein